ncbi:hypothetical protein KDA00_00700 [Candidatus Saccharibacteria bacterium]|nr:hypothetical protein [Candidatus Saccharibacteria bacterium]
MQKHHSRESGHHGHESKGERQLDLEAESRKNLERIHEKANKSQETTKEHVEHIKSKVETHAVSGKEFTVGERESVSHGHHHPNQKELKTDAYQKTLKNVRRRLSKPDKLLSKVIHNKTVESVSEVGGKTIARPSGILGGGLCALLGSAFLLYMSSHYGFEYNYFVFFMLFAGGFFVGMFGELLLRYILKKDSSI